MTAVSRSTQILIDNFIQTYFSHITSENREKIKDSVAEIADCILEQSNKDIDKLATKDDIANLKDDTRKEISALKDDITSLRDETKTAIAELRNETKTAIALLRDETKVAIAELRDETKVAIAELRDETKKDIAILRDETKTETSALRSDIAKLELKITESKYDLLKWIVTAQLAIAGLLLAMIKLI